MGSIRDGGMTTWLCDYCERLLEFDAGMHYADILKQGKELGWRVFKDGNTWHHACASCMSRRSESRGGSRRRRRRR